MTDPKELEISREDIYQPKERVRILQEHTYDYEIEDIETGATYIVDKSYFQRKYEKVNPP